MERFHSPVNQQGCFLFPPRQILTPSHHSTSHYPDTMEFSEESITEFTEIYEREFNEKISRDDAVEMARRLISLYQLFLRRPLLMPDDVYRSLDLVERDEEQ